MSLDRARVAYARREWEQAFELLSRADEETALEPDDLWRLAWSAALTARDDLFLRTVERAHDRLVEAGEPGRAARAAFWVGFRLYSRGEHARGGGWIGRAQRLVERAGGDCAEQGYLLLPLFYRQLDADPGAAREIAARAVAIGERFGDVDLVAYARGMEGRALVTQGELAAGLALLDEAMIAATSEQVNPMITGLVYCGVIGCCQEVHAFDRAREWTAVLARWCDAQPEESKFSSTCRVHRAQILQLCGEWREAIEETRRARERMESAPNPFALAEAHYQQAEIERMRGELALAELSYRHAGEAGGETQPGLALLRLAQGRVDEAVGAIRRALDTTPAMWRRVRLLPAYVEILLRAGDLEDADAAARELEQLAASIDNDVLGAIAAHARGAVRLAEGNPQAAIEPLRRAFAIWHGFGAPYLAARIRVLLGRACAALGDRDGAALELDCARQVFKRLGAAPDLAALDALAPSETPRRDDGLTERELQVLRLVASGRSNKEIATALFVSERTIDRHVSNIFNKLDVHSRAAATAFAYEHGLL